jgi:hypothetical protein
MVSVTARKIRDHGRERPAAVDVGRIYTGYLISYPVVGRGLVIFRDPNGHRMITTPVRRVLGDLDALANQRALPEGAPLTQSVYVETENSVYRLEFHPGRTSSAPPAPPAPEVVAK